MMDLSDTPEFIEARETGLKQGRAEGSEAGRHECWRDTLRRLLASRFDDPAVTERVSSIPGPMLWRATEVAAASSVDYFSEWLDSFLGEGTEIIDSPSLPASDDRAAWLISHHKGLREGREEGLREGRREITCLLVSARVDDPALTERASAIPDAWLPEAIKLAAIAWVNEFSAWLDALEHDAAGIWGLSDRPIDLGHTLLVAQEEGLRTVRRHMVRQVLAGRFGSMTLVERVAEIPDARLSEAIHVALTATDPQIIAWLDALAWDRPRAAGQARTDGPQRQHPTSSF